jgi:hypothetical protein
VPVYVDNEDDKTEPNAIYSARVAYERRRRRVEMFQAVGIVSAVALLSGAIGGYIAVMAPVFPGRNCLTVCCGGIPSAGVGK